DLRTSFIEWQINHPSTKAHLSHGGFMAPAVCAISMHGDERASRSPGQLVLGFSDSPLNLIIGHPQNSSGEPRSLCVILIPGADKSLCHLRAYLLLPRSTLLLINRMLAS